MLFLTVLLTSREKSDVEWTNRWDAYLLANSPNDKVHWFSITNSIMIVLLLTVMIGMILIRNLRKDIAKYNDPVAIEDANEESGWKLVHGDVFRPPSTLPMLFRYLYIFVSCNIFISSIYHVVLHLMFVIHSSLFNPELHCQIFGVCFVLLLTNFHVIFTVCL